MKRIKETVIYTGIYVAIYSVLVTVFSAWSVEAVAALSASSVVTGGAFFSGYGAGRSDA
jgi:hypothetical protein